MEIQVGNAERPAEVLARQVKYWRDRRKLSAQGLADRIAEDKGTLDRPAIFKIENRKRNVSVEEWLQLAYALAIPPALLFIDLAKGNDDIAIVPGAEVHPWLAWEWVVGDHEPITSDRRGKRTSEWLDARRYVRLYEREMDAKAVIRKVERDLRSAEYAGNAEQIQAAKTQQVEAYRTLAGIFDEMVEQGMTPPGQPPHVVKFMGEFALLRYPHAVEVFDPDDGEE